MTDASTRQLLGLFLDAVVPVPSLVCVWAHGSLAGGDYQPGRSDLDLVAVVERRCPPALEERLVAAHEKLAATHPLAAKLHCSYVAADEWGDLAAAHLTWAHEELMHRPVTPVTRRELHDFGEVLHGPPPADLLPPVTDRELSDFVAEDLAHFWRPALDHPERWLREVWVDLGLLTLARADVTLRTGRLISKAQALDVLTALGAPADVVHDIRRRRYGGPRSASDQWPARRAELTRAFLAPAIERVLAAARP
ncbi:nucleotidyltransferase [Streptomyces sp. NPDC059582]|uniref:nucleotidyltransferase n=1 Tax=Streptomyces sp. NPDC059582 TaxID=3346875 RepID=UPI0036764A25